MGALIFWAAMLAAALAVIRDFINRFKRREASVLLFIWTDTTAGRLFQRLVNAGKEVAEQFRGLRGLSRMLGGGPDK